MSRSLADIVAPSEYGITREDRLKIGALIGRPLIKKFLADLDICMLELFSDWLDSRLLKQFMSSARVFE